MTLIDSSTVASPRAERPGRTERDLEVLAVGQTVRVTVLRRLDAAHYEARVGEVRSRVESALTLIPGTSVEARVVALGSPLELRVLEAPDPDRATAANLPVDLDKGASNVSALVAQLAEQLRVPLRAADRVMLSGLASKAQDPLVMAQAGLYLLRQGVDPTPSAVEALYEALRQRSANDQALTGAPPPTVAAVPGSTGAIDSPVAAALLAALNGSTLPAGGEGTQSGNSGDDAQRHRQQLAQWLLNVSDAGSVGYRYGTLPLLVSGRLVEIDLALFQEQPSAQVARPLHRMVMSVQTQHFGSVRVRLEALEGRLQVRVSSESAAGTAALSDSEPQLRALLADMGWQVESLAFHTEDALRPAAHAIVQHVLHNGSIDRAW